jgi:hypothetical protein
MSRLTWLSSLSTQANAALAVLLIGGAGPLAAQRPGCVGAVTVPTAALDPAERLRRLGEPANGAQDLIRESAACDERADTGSTSPRRALSLYGPSERLVWNNRLADARNDGALWAGRGRSAILRVGGLADLGPLHLVLVPEVWRAENTAFDIFPSPLTTRSSFASPFYFGATSADLPSRMGADPVKVLSLGQSAVWLDVGPLAVGWSAANLQWGGGRDGLLFGNSSAGVPRLFVRTSRPIATALGRWSGTWFVGRVTESRFFDQTSANDQREIGAVAIGWAPSHSDAFALTLARAALRPIARGAGVSLQSLGAPVRPITGDAGDELFALSARLHVPRASTRAWVEFAHAGPLRLRDLVTAPNAGIAYRLGAEKAVVYADGAWHVLFEAANLEMPRDFADRATHDFYTGWGTAHGWTQRGQLLGDGIGPGGQSQFASATWITPHWLAGGFAERVRWNEDALFREYATAHNRHDVTMRLGVTGGLTLPGYRTLFELSWGKRINYLFQNAAYLPDYRTVDVSLRQLKVTVTPSGTGAP